MLLLIPVTRQRPAVRIYKNLSPYIDGPFISSHTNGYFARVDLFRWTMLSWQVISLQDRTQVIEERRRLSTPRSRGGLRLVDGTTHLADSCYGDDVCACVSAVSTHICVNARAHAHRHRFTSLSRVHTHESARACAHARVRVCVQERERISKCSSVNIYINTSNCKYARK